jgi:hypothetical protein
MPLNETDIVQSFTLRFWREPTQSKAPHEAPHWRGKIWHEQMPGGQAASVAEPEDAFEMIRLVLHSGASISASALRDDRASSRTFNCIATQFRAICPLASLWQRIFRRRS